MPWPFFFSLTSRRKVTRLQSRGIILLIVLVVIVVLALAAYTFSDLMMTHRQATRWSGRRVQARLLAESGVVALQRFLTLDPQCRDAEGGIYDNPGRFRGVAVSDGNRADVRGGFSIVTAAVDQRRVSRDVRFGVEDESARLNINALLLVDGGREEAAFEMLMGLPGMTAEIADAILDWLDADDESRPYGAETDYYRSLPQPYAAKNGPLDSVEELLLVRGVTPTLLFGRDHNHNNFVDPLEMQTADDNIPSLRGWSSLLTIYSNEHIDQSSHEERVYVNQDDMQRLYDELLAVFDNNRQWALYIVAYRQNGPFAGEKTMESTTRELDLSAPAQFPVRHVLDLVGQNVRVTMQGDSTPIVLPSPFQADEVLDLLPQLDAALSVYAAPNILGRVNVLEASPEVLRSIPGLDENMLEQILAGRTSPTATQDEMWLLRENIVTLDEFRKVAPFINHQGSTYRAQVVGYSADGKAFCRLEVVVDSGGDVPRLLMCRDLSRFGPGFSRDGLGLASPETRQ